MQHFLTRCSVAVLTGSLAFALTYWYIRRQKNLKCESRNGKMNSESCDKKSLVVTDVMLNVIVEDVEQGLKFDRKHDKVMDVNEVPVLEVPVNSLQETKEDQIDDLPKSDKLLIADEEEILEPLSIWKVSEAHTGNRYMTRRSENVVDEQCSNLNIMEYRSANTPSSEGSQDSGRATGGLASSLSPADDTAPRASPETRSVYEFEIPNTLVGLIIGIKGKTIKELCLRTQVRMIIRPHHTSGKLETHQICAVEGSRENINKCLRMTRRRFPAARFPELNLRPVLPPPFPDPPAALYGTRPVQLTLPEGERCRVICSATIDVGHFFLQQPQHPTFNSLQRLDYYMLGVYMQPAGVPDLPRPVDVDKLCVAPAFDGWYRAVTLDYYQEEDEVMVRYVDYGGYGRLPRSDLRQIRTDFMTLPFQAVECYLAHVMPVDGTTKWSDDARELFQILTEGRTLECYVVGYHIDDSRPFVEMFTVDENNRVDRIDCALLDANLAKAWDPSKVRPVLPKSVPPLTNTLLS